MATPAVFPSEVAQRIKELIDDAAPTLYGEHYQVLYGDQNRIAVTPTVCIEAGATNRTLAGVPMRTENNHVTYIIIYWAKVDSNQVTKLQCEQVAEATARMLDDNLILERVGDGGIVIHGHVSSIEPGYSYKDQAKTLYYSARLTWTGKTKTTLGA